MKRLALGAAVFLVVLAGPARAQDRKFAITLTAGKDDCSHVPVTVPLYLPAEWKKPAIDSLRIGKERLAGQLTQPGILTEAVKGEGANTLRRDLHFILPGLKAGESVTVDCVLYDSGAAGFAWVKGTPVFAWDDQRGEHATLSFGPAGGKGRPVLRYMYKAYDDSKPELRNKTYKVFHHVYDPEGKRFVTNGGHTDELPEKSKLVFPHHRGLMVGWNKITYGEGKKADSWHCQKDDHQSHQGFREVEAGRVLGRHRVAVDWHGAGKEVIVKEEREMTVYNVPGGTLIEFVARLKPASGKVRLDGDPQHAGFQFRAHNDVGAKTAAETYYLRPDGKGKPRETRNWEPKTKKGPVNLPWDALSFVLDGQRYTAAYLNHPRNPGESRWSERDYGRFGCYFEHELTEDRPLVMGYRVWLQNGEMTVPEVEALHRAFVTPPAVTVK